MPEMVISPLFYSVKHFSSLFTLLLLKTLLLVVPKAKDLVPMSPEEACYKYSQSLQGQQTAEGPRLHCTYQIILQVPEEERQKDEKVRVDS